MDLDPEIYKELIKTFHGEFEEQIDLLTEQLLLLEKEKDAKKNEEIINTIFRIAHTIKGSARSVEIEKVAIVGHRLEDLFGEVRQAKISVTPEVIDVCFSAIDCMKEAMQSFMAGNSDDINVQPVIDKICNILGVSALEGEDLGKTEASEQDRDALAQAETRVGVGAEETSVSINSEDFVKVNLSKINEVTALSDELQGIKLEIDDCLSQVYSLGTKLTGLEDLCRKGMFSAHHVNDAEVSEELANIFQLGLRSINEITNNINYLQHNVRNSTSELGFVSSSLQDNVRMLRLVSIGVILKPMLRSARDIARELNKDISINIEGDDIQIDRSVINISRDPLLHLLRNAIDHGIETQDQRVTNNKPAEGRIDIRVTREGDFINITMQDDGNGIDVDSVARVAVEKCLVSEDDIAGFNEEQLLEFIFHPGFSTKKIITDLSGRGVGLDVVRTNIRSIKGDVSVSTKKGEGTKFKISLPMTLASDRGMLVRVNKQIFAIPTSSVERVVELSLSDIIDVESGQAIMHLGKPVALKSLGDVFSVETQGVKESTSIPVVIVSKGWSEVALIVDDIIGEREIVVKHFTKPLVSVKNISGATLTGRGEVIIVLNPIELVDYALNSVSNKIKLAKEEKVEEKKSAKILVVDDSITTRTLETNILEINGYHVTACVDGKMAWEQLAKAPYDLVITDVEMPNMNGFELSALIKQDKAYKEIPVIIVTSRSSDKDQQRGIEVGADAYIVKNKFETTNLIKTVERLL